MTAPSQVLLAVGCFLGYLANAVFHSNVNNWPYMLLCGVPFAMILLIPFAIYAPKSPRWLIMRGRYEELASMKFVVVIRCVQVRRRRKDPDAASIAKARTEAERSSSIFRHAGRFYIPSHQ